MSANIIREKPCSSGSNRQSGLNSKSPLKLFSSAKLTINDILKYLSLYIQDINIYFNDVIKFDGNVISDELFKNIQNSKEQINNISSMISRDHMKVVFFGRTSNGKSTVINAMLRERILPVGLGHTTNCFLQIEGTDKTDAFFSISEHDQTIPINNLNTISNALSSNKLDSDSLVKIYWPKEKCRLIRDDVVLVDSPGIDVSTNLDQWIEKYCLDADVFILVVSAESTIAGAEKCFLYNVAQRLSNPNIFLLMNRWDATDNETENIDLVRKQHVERGLEFLCDELKLCDRKEASDKRIFFISAREALLNRNIDTTISTKTSSMDGYKERLIEFSRFESEFEKCISKAAIKTKFEQHAIRANQIVEFLCESLNDSMNKCETTEKLLLKSLDEMDQRINSLECELRSITDFTRDRIRNISDEAYKRVSQTLKDEIKRIYTLIEDFDRPFSSEHDQIPLYKDDLNCWMEKQLSSHLYNRLHTAIYLSLNSIHDEIKERTKSILTNTQRKLSVDSIILRSDFAISYRLDCSNLCSDFREDIQFKFSLGLPTLWRNFVQNQKHFYIFSKPFLNPSNDLKTEANDIQTLPLKSSFILLAASAIIWRYIGWKTVGIISGFYSSFYIYERLLWTKKAQERAFKRQYADYASAKMKLIIDFISGNASAQIQQELSMCFAQTIRHVALEKDELVNSIQQRNEEIQQLLSLIEKGKTLKRRGDNLYDHLHQFSKQYLFSNL